MELNRGISLRTAVKKCHTLQSTMNKFFSSVPQVSWHQQPFSFGVSLLLRFIHLAILSLAFSLVFPSPARTFTLCFQGKHRPFTTIPCLLRQFKWCVQPFGWVVGWVHSPADNQWLAASLWDHCSGQYSSMSL